MLEDFGPVDLLVHNAGIASRGLDVAHTEPAEIERLFRTHALGAFVLCKHLVPQMRDRERADVVMISSVATSHMAANSSPYNMAKAALEALAMTLAKEERRNGIHVNVVAPGLVATEMGRRLVKGAMGVEDITHPRRGIAVRPRVHPRGGRRRRPLPRRSRWPVRDRRQDHRRRWNLLSPKQTRMWHRYPPLMSHPPATIGAWTLLHS